MIAFYVQQKGGSASMDGEMNGQLENDANHLLRRLQEQHRFYSQQLESLTKKPYLSEDEKLEEVRLKKLKLRLKDQMSGLPNALNNQNKMINVA
jgi:hypothetical protein